jgi:hypothetical protein
MENTRLGGNIDSWCGKCKMLLAHTIDAMVGDKVTRVTCNTCKSAHAYKSAAPKTGTRTGTPRAGAANRYQSLMKNSETVVAKNYSPQNKYEAGDVLQHFTLGRGAIMAVKEGAKIEVLFESGLKTLIHARGTES